MKPSFSFGKEEKLKSKKLLEQLFATSKSFTVFPIKLMFIQVTEKLDFPIKTAVGCSSKHFKNATDRNKIKRMLREQYRLNKIALHQTINTQQKQLAIFILYIDKIMPEKNTLPLTMPKVINKLIKSFE